MLAIPTPLADDWPLRYRLSSMSTKTATPPRWLTSREVCDRLNIHLNTLATYIRKGEMGKVLWLSGKDRRISEAALQEFINRRLVG